MVLLAFLYSMNTISTIICMFRFMVLLVFLYSFFSSINTISTIICMFRVVVLLVFLYSFFFIYEHNFYHHLYICSVLYYPVQYSFLLYNFTRSTAAVISIQTISS